MCGRFGLFARAEAIEDRFDATFQFDYEPRYNVAPEAEPVAAVPDEAPDALEPFSWGLVPHWVEDPDDWPSPINARAETVHEKPAFRDAFRNRRCLVPANGFYEWTGRRGKRIPHWITVDDDGLFAMAGIWETWGDEGDRERSLAIVTTASNGVVGELHDRMPVILEPDEERTWLASEDEDELRGLLDPYPDERTAEREVSTAVNVPSNDSPALIEPVGGDQSGLDEF